MYPILIGEGEWALPSYFALAMLGFLAAVYFARVEARRQGLDVTRVVDLAILMLIAGVIGSRVFHVLFDGFLGDYIDLCMDPSALGLPLPDGSPCQLDDPCMAAQRRGLDIGALCDVGSGQCVPERDCLRALKFWSGGLVWYGGLIFAMLLMWLYGRRRLGMSFLHAADLYSPSVAIGLGLGRVGCFLSGCCFGGVCELPWAVRFPPGSDAWEHHREHALDALKAQYADGIKASLPVHPTQLYEAISMVLIFALLWFGLRERRRYHGQLLAWLLILYAIVRFVIEIVREDARGALLGLSTSQWISAVMIAGGVALIVRGRQRRLGPPPDPGAPPAAAAVEADAPPDADGPDGPTDGDEPGAPPAAAAVEADAPSDGVAPEAQRRRDDAP